MTSDPALVRTIDKILDRAKKDIGTGLEASLKESQEVLDDSVSRLEQEYEKIISDGRKEADKLEKQLIGSADLETRNKQLILVEESVERVFDEAIKKIKKTRRNAEYADMMSELLDGATETLRAQQTEVFVNTKDQRVIKKILVGKDNIKLAPDAIECMGGMVVKSQDGIMTFDNTVDARLERMKPLIRKKIAAKFGVGE